MARLARITPLEAGILALGRRELAPLFAEETDPALRDSFLEAKVFLVYRKDLNNLSLQQTRLRKHRDLVTTELLALQEKRKRTAYSQSRQASEYYLVAREKNLPFHLTDFGFEFTLDDFFEQIARSRSIAVGDRFPNVTLNAHIQHARAEYNAKH